MSVKRIFICQGYMSYTKMNSTDIAVSSTMENEQQNEQTAPVVAVEEAPKKVAKRKVKAVKVVVDEEAMRKAAEEEAERKRVEEEEAEAARKAAEELEMVAVPVVARPVGLARTLAEAKKKLTDASIASLLDDAESDDRRHEEDEGLDEGEFASDLTLALKELMEFRRLAEEKRQKANEASKKSKAKKKGGDGEDASVDGESVAKAPKKSKAELQAEEIAKHLAKMGVKKEEE